MKDKIKSTEINVNKENIIPIADVKQESQCVLTLELYKDNVAFDITGQTVKLGAKTADGNVQSQESGFTINKNILTVDLKNSINSVVGLLEIDLTFTDSTGIMTTSSFYLNVIKKTLGKDNIIASNQLEAVKVLIEDLKTKGNNTIADIKKDYGSLKKVIIDNNAAANLQVQISENKQNITNNTSEIEKLKNLQVQINENKQQLVENTNSVENILQELLNCIKKDGSIPFETGQDKGIKIGENIDIVEVNNNIYIRNKSNPNDFKILQLTHDGFLLPAGNLQIGSGNYRFRKIWVGSESNSVERGFVTLTNDWVLIFGAVNNAPGQEAARFEFPMRVERFFHASLTGQWMNEHNHYWTLGMTDYQTYIEVIKHNNIGVSDQCNIMLLCKL